LAYLSQFKSGGSATETRYDPIERFISRFWPNRTVSELVGDVDGSTAREITQLPILKDYTFLAYPFYGSACYILLIPLVCTCLVLWLP